MSKNISLDNYKEMYTATKEGKIYSKYTEKYLKGFYNKDGYEIVTLYDKNSRKGKQVRVHRFVAYCLVDGYEEGLYVNHIDGDKTNNHADNLEWVTPKENTEHAVKILGTVGLKGELSHSFGRKVSKEVREKISKTLKETNRGRIFYNNVSVKGTHVSSSEEVYFEGVSQAGREMNIYATKISKVLHGKQETVGGYR